MKNKIAVIQLSPIIGDVEYNKNKAIEYIKKTIELKAELVIFPELFLSGNPIFNIIKRYPHILKQCQDAINEIKSYCRNVSVLIGYPKEESTDYISSICYLKNGEIISEFKHLSDSANIESIANNILEFNEKKFTILFNDDINNDKLKISNDAVLYFNSDISRTKSDYLQHIKLQNIAKENKKRIIYINQASANDSYIYSGLSRLYNEEGKVVSIASGFKEDILISDIFSNNQETVLPTWLNNTPSDEYNLNYEYDLDRTYSAIVFGIKEYFSKNNLKRAVLGLSGGLDSSVCAVLLADALGKENVLGISMPSKLTSSDSKNDALNLAKNLGINFLEIPIKDCQVLLGEKLESLYNQINWCERYKTSYTQDNIQARTRATILWGVSNEYPATIPIATSDKSESYMGYATINGDMSGGYAPIADVTKTKLFALARRINKNGKNKDVIPLNIITKPPGAELAINPETGKTLTAEEALMPYEFLDEVIWRIENYHQTIDDMSRSEFLYEKKNNLPKEQKSAWLEKFARRMNSALYKWSISVCGPIIDTHSINKTEYMQPISSNIKY